ncbi:hypothetical protein I7I50_08767 [Histoplasma capsulatum G186AR]|uniref:Uncharacterized protein n=1 Tax=Ajellomyces capsulatus TaxID=5037 RepID=A0A8H8CZ61_AJECA|nr:hypothetical protein I7I52_06281 [Histoplasma capsulatum]QSS73844.1 hypothetical protein I7I50_08767 [Histoplasma capsulatum G186AR]
MLVRGHGWRSYLRSNVRLFTPSISPVSTFTNAARGDIPVDNSINRFFLNNVTFEGNNAVILSFKPLVYHLLQRPMPYVGYRNILEDKGLSIFTNLLSLILEHGKSLNLKSTSFC